MSTKIKKTAQNKKTLSKQVSLKKKPIVKVTKTKQESKKIPAKKMVDLWIINTEEDCWEFYLTCDSLKEAKECISNDIYCCIVEYELPAIN